MSKAPPDFRRATRADLDAIVRMLADDILGSGREHYSQPLPDSYVAAFEAIDRSPEQELIVAELEGEVVGVLQLTMLPGLSHQGGWRALIEGVRVASSTRGQGVGRALFEWAIERARVRGCYVVQLTTDKRRIDARRFYEGLGFIASHEGMKLPLG